MSSAETKQFWRKEVKQQAMRALGDKCQVCGGTFPISVYDFHHINPNEKDFTFSSFQFNGPSAWESIRDEIKKCALVCANCHRILHNEGTIQLESIFNMEFYEWNESYLESIRKVRGDNRYNITNHTCPMCGGEKAKQAKACMSCASKMRRRSDRPNREELKILVRNHPFTEIGRQFGISDNAIRKWCKQENLPTSSRVIKQMSDNEWMLI